MASNRIRTYHLPAVVGAIFLQTPSQLALWDHELTGQISDGMWEGARPNEHYQFWCRLERKLDPQGTLRVETPCSYMILKHSYSFSRLRAEAPDVWSRMISLGRLAVAASIMGLPMEYEQRIAAEDMPATMDDYLERLATSPAAQERFLKAVPQQLAGLYYTHPTCKAYDERRMRKDLASVRAAMKNVVDVPKPASA